MNDAAARLLKITQFEESSKVIRLEDGQEIAQIAVTVDGTWQKRGHCSTPVFTHVYLSSV